MTGRGPVREVAGVMLRLGAIAFGGPAVHVAMMRDEIVRRREWLDDRAFLDLFGAVSVLPGPSSTQLGMALSRRRAGWRGLIVGGVCFIAPAMAVVLGLAWAYARYGATPTGGGILYGVEPVVVAIVAVALRDLSRTALRRRWMGLLAAAALAAYFAGVNVLIVLAAAGVVALLVERRAPVSAPLALVGRAAAHRPGLVSVAGEFLKLGVVVFGSGYVLLAFLRRDLVTQLHWLTARQVLDAVSAGQVTPGPVFTTATFLGYLLHGFGGAVVATAGIFVPSFAMVAALDPIVHRLRRSPAASSALAGISAAALGLMAAVTVDLARTAVTGWVTAALAVAALGAVWRWRVNAVWVVAAGAAVGVAHRVW